MDESERQLTAAAGVLLAVGMAAGVWKWQAMRRSPDARAPLYVDVLHRAALMYAAATLVLARLVVASTFPAAWNRAAFWLCWSFFVITLATYAVHGLRRRATTMFSERTFFTGPGMFVLVAAELGPTLFLVVGALR